jgi:imidazolonepropionase-like amidohydrolase
MTVGLFALVFGIGALPVVFLYLASPSREAASDRERGGDAAAQTVKQLQAKQKQIVAFINVNVVPMDEERVLAGQTVIIKDGRIAELGPAEQIKIPAAAVRVDGRGKYLMPGLADMHVHFESYDAQTNGAMLDLFVVNGVTTVLNLYGAPSHLELRERIARGEVLGPTIYTSGPFISHAPVHSPSPEEVERAVIEQKQDGYDVIKIHGDFSREAYRKVFEVARQEGMRVIGHAPRNLGVEPMFAERQDAVAHVEEYIYAYFYFKPDPALAGAPQERRLRWIAEQEGRIPALAQATAKAGTWVIPTLTVYHGIGLQVDDIDPVMRRPEMKYLPPGLASRFAPENNTYLRRFKKETAKIFLAQSDLLSKVVKEMHTAGVKLLAGTDTPVPSVVPGFSLHDELQELAAAGLTPYETLRTATANAAEFLSSNEFGTVAIGKRADLLLVDGDPLKDVRNAARRSGVMVRGRWFTQEELSKILGKLAAATVRPERN